MSVNNSIASELSTRQQVAMYVTYTLTSTVTSLTRLVTEFIALPSTIYHIVKANQFEKKLYEGNESQRNDNTAHYLYHKSKVIAVKYSLINAAIEFIPVVGPLAILVARVIYDKHLIKCGPKTLNELGGQEYTNYRSYPQELDSNDLDQIGLNTKFRNAEGRLNEIRRQKNDTYREPEITYFAHLNHF